MRTRSCAVFIAPAFPHCCCGLRIAVSAATNSSTMGNASSASPHLTAEQEDLKFLADRYPFGDKELGSIYRRYQSLLAASERTSFLQDWVTTEEQQALFRVVEEQILTKGWGDRFYQSAFQVEGDVSLYPAANSVPTNAVDEFTRKARLERLGQGWTDAGRRGGRTAAHVVFRTCASKKEMDDGSTVVSALELVDTGYRLALASAFLQSSSNLLSKQESDEDEDDEDDSNPGSYLPTGSVQNDVDLQSLALSLVNRGRNRRQRLATGSEKYDDLDQGLVRIEDVWDWLDEVAPLFGSVLPTFVHHVLFPDSPHPPTRTPLDFPRLSEDSVFFHSPDSPLLFSFSCLSAALGGPYFRLYTSLHDGLSFNRLQNALLGYAGPTLLLIHASQPKGAIFGAFTASPWKESKDFYGNSDCFLFQLAPTTIVYRPTGQSRNFMYCNSYARSRGYDQLPHGLGFGGTPDAPRLFLSESFDDCRAGTQCLTFEKGPMLPLSEDGGLQKYFELESLEVFGVGGSSEIVEQALQGRAKLRAVRDANIQKARKVDKAQFLDDFRSGAISSKAFKYREQIDGRADADVDERHRKDYDYEG